MREVDRQLLAEAGRTNDALAGQLRLAIAQVATATEQLERVLSATCGGFVTGALAMIAGWLTFG